ncbi:thermolysin [Bhargavaea beijingensis]|uniref:Neutral metalloproteinase n=1 Tax=Bhargavaea beijingensis TaxID=426756 RepID=A0A1G7GTJ1_9BACL|nr:thermolysin [Bhargavaea beijingensis]
MIVNKRKLAGIGAAALMALSLTVGSASANSHGISISKNEDLNVPNLVSGELTKPSAKPAASIVYEYLKKEKGLFGYSGEAASSFEVMSEEKDELGYTHVRLQQKHMGTPVFGSVLTAHVDKNGVLTAVSGTAVPNLDKKSTLAGKNKVTKADAFKIGKEAAEKKLGDKVDKFEKEEHPKLVIYALDGQPRYAYQMRFEVLDPAPGNFLVFVDAKTGEIIRNLNEMHEAKGGTGSLSGTVVTGSGTGVLGDSKTFKTFSTADGYYLYDATRGKGVYTYDGRNQTRIPGTLWLDADNRFGASYDRAAVDAHTYAAWTYDYFRNVHNRNSYDNAGAELVSTVHYGRSYNNAGWTGSQMIYGDGDGYNFRAFSGSLDVVAHELTHAVTDFSADLIYQNESGAINESMSDIFGTLTEYHFNNNPDWLMGEDIYTPGTPGDALRSMADPTLAGDPDHYSKRYIGTQDNGGVHINSGIGNKMAYLLANGGTHYGVKVNGIGNTKVGKIMYRTLTQYLTPTSNYSHFRASAIRAATDLYGASSAEVAAVKQAFSAVGVY